MKTKSRKKARTLAADIATAGSATAVGDRLVIRHVTRWLFFGLTRHSRCCAYGNPVKGNRLHYGWVESPELAVTFATVAEAVQAIGEQRVDFASVCKVKELIDLESN